jgi:Fic family protein
VSARVETIPAVGWEPISDLPDDLERLELQELRSLDALWREKRAELEELDEMRTFREKLVRTWAIETGVIERVYDLDRGTTELLIEHGLKSSLIDRASTDKDPEFVARIIGDQRDAIEGLFDFIKRERSLSVGYVKELHATLTRSQTHVEALDQFEEPVSMPLVHGDWKQMPNNPRRPDGTVHEYCPVEQVAPQMERLVELHLAHERRGVPPEVEAAWLHHRFTQIHPFQDGNGRVARALATLIFLRAGWFPLTIDRDRKAHYIDSLEAADLGELRYLVRQFGSVERDAIVRALGIGDQAARELEGLEQVVHAARDDLLLGASERESEELHKVRETADRLQDVGRAELDAIKQLIDREISEYRPEFSTRVDHAAPGDKKANWYFRESVDLAHKFHYFANLRTYAAWMRLRIWDREANTWDDLIVVFHGVGREFRGLIAAAAFYAQYQLGSEKGRKDRELTRRETIADELFQVNYLEDADLAAGRFRDWLRGVLAIGLGQWRASLPAGRGTKQS